MKTNKRISNLDRITDRHDELFLQSNNVMRKNWGKSPYSRHSQSRWCLPDDEILYKKNIEENFKLMKVLGFVDSHMNDDFYSFNDYGFRSDSFDKDKDKGSQWLYAKEDYNKCTILFNGCSQTMGIGLPLQDIWPKKIADHYNVNYHNIAVGGSDFGHIAQRSVYWLYKLRPKYHIIKETMLTRFNWWQNNSIQSTTLTTKKLGEDILDIALDDDNIEWARYISLKVIKSVCDELDIKLLVLPPGNIDQFWDRKQDLARDLMHYGCKEQNRIVQYIIEKEFIKI